MVERVFNRAMPYSDEARRPSRAVQGIQAGWRPDFPRLQRGSARVIEDRGHSGSRRV